MNGRRLGEERGKRKEGKEGREKMEEERVVVHEGSKEKKDGRTRRNAKPLWFYFFAPLRLKRFDNPDSYRDSVTVLCVRCVAVVLFLCAFAVKTLR